MADKPQGWVSTLVSIGRGLERQLRVCTRVVICSMKTEELAQEPVHDPLQFDAHEFDGLREAFEKDAQGMLAKMDHYIRDNPWLCIGLAAVAGFAVACATQRRSSPEKDSA